MAHKYGGQAIHLSTYVLLCSFFLFLFTGRVELPGDSSSRGLWPDEHRGTGSRATGNFPSTCLNTRWGRRDENKVGDWLQETHFMQIHLQWGVLWLRWVFSLSLTAETAESLKGVYYYLCAPRPDRRSQFGADVAKFSDFLLSMEVAVELIRTKPDRPARIPDPLFFFLSRE